MAYLGQEMKKLGFGLMRLPRIGKEVDIEQTKKMVDLFLERGFNYFDTAWGYEDSEVSIKKALTDRHPRESYQLATKLPAWLAATKEDAHNMFWTSLERTGVDYFDFYLLHNFGGADFARSKAFDRYGIWDFLQTQKAEGRIRHLGFSIHANADHLDEILTTHPEMEFVQLQINYADWDSVKVQSKKCYEVARKHGKPVIIMEPVKGGALAALPPQVEKIFTDANPEMSLASWAIRYAASLDGIITVLSGMSTLAQVEDNTSYMAELKPLSDEERRVVERAQKTLAEIPQIPCTNCGYCLAGCPQKILIPTVFHLVNEYMIYQDEKRVQGNYVWESRGSGKASECISCGACELVCPQSIAIIDELEKAARLLEP